VQVMPLEKSVKIVKKNIQSFDRRINGITVHAMYIEGIIKLIRKKLATANTKHPFIKHYKFSLTR